MSEDMEKYSKEGMRRWEGTTDNKKKNINSENKTDKSEINENTLKSHQPRLPIILLIIGILGLITIVVILIFYSLQGFSNTEQIIENGNNSRDSENIDNYDDDSNKQNLISKEDINPPTLVNISVTPNEIDESGVINISVTAKDDITGVEHLIASIHDPKKLNNESGKGLEFSVHLRNNENINRWEGTAKIEKYYESGIWNIGSIYITDTAGNMNHYFLKSYTVSGNYQFDEGNGTIDSGIGIVSFNVKNTIPDNEVPILKNLSIEPSIISGSGEIIIKADISDMGSGINYSSVNIASPSMLDTNKKGGKELSIYLKYNSSAKLWEGKTIISYYYESGLWKIKSIYLKDNAANIRKYEYKPLINKDNYLEKVNETYVNSKIPIITFSIDSTDGDMVNPELIKLSVSPEKIINSGKISVKAILKDVGTGVKYASVVLHSPSKQKNALGGEVEINNNLKYNSESEYWETSIVLESYHESGKWIIGHIHIKDISGNRVHYIINKKISHSNYVFRDNSTGKYIVSDIPIANFIKQ